MKNISVKVEDELHTRASQKAGEWGLSLAEVVRVAIRAYCGDGASANGELIDEVRGQLRVKDTQIESLLEQVDHAHQLLALSQKAIGQLTDQNQLLLEDQRHRERKMPWFKRTFRWT